MKRIIYVVILTALTSCNQKVCLGIMRQIRTNKVLVRNEKIY